MPTLILTVVALAWSLNAFAQTQVKVSLLLFNGKQREVYHSQFAQFQNENPDLRLVIQDYEAEKYKAAIPEWLARDSHSDVMYWFSGERLNWFVKQNWIQPIDDVWESSNWDKMLSVGSKSTVLINNHLYALPMHYYPWAIYYKKSLFKKYDIPVPTDWTTFLQAGELLKQNRIAPIAVGSVNNWPFAAWFDYLNLRINGIDFHKQLMSGEADYQSDEVRQVFRYWQYLIENEFFIKGHEKYTWKEVLPYLYREKAGMMLMGNFWTSQIPDNLVEEFELIRFPMIKPEMPFYEEAPTNVWFIPKNRQNHEGAVRFLTFMARQDVQEKINQAIGMLAPNRYSEVGENHFLQTGKEVLDSAAGLSQFYDRDNPQPIATRGIKLMGQFAKNPKELNSILKQFDELAQESFK
ncbi:ABC transporter substrate-binding protein [Vibrio algarum]|uniref:Extracellular solute-binding protein n=1 Tax=Vibrio algarum TaxID=3020714 RepID=A0ABT4YPY3_9VIBR|nr:extracellular solute-binding protein [Vibrio sp. KJ40-1]MDB1123535.1 extracellular solute-binding protein [Vibrio sp. KJ40-1]